MIASMLGDQGLKVFTNPTGSNFTRGVVSALLGSVNAAGRLNADIAVLELDEAYAVHFVKQVKPRFSLLLNVMRDQLDRFGEIDNTARLLSHVAESTTGTVVLNREDRRIAALAQCVPEDTSVRYFGLSDALKTRSPPMTICTRMTHPCRHPQGRSMPKMMTIPLSRVNSTQRP
jgi:lipid II isoglutaminyl synthase (glutamine-hydrolysing)